MKTGRKQYSAEFKARMVQEILRETKMIGQLVSEFGVPKTVLYHWREQALAGLPSLFSDQHAQEQAERDRAWHQERDALFAEIGRLTTQLAWLKKNLVSSLRRSERKDLIEWEAATLSVTQQAELLALHRSTLYYQPRPPTAKEVALKHRIDITYARLRGGWVYVVAVVDWYSRSIVSWQLDQTLEIAFVLDAVDQALAQRVPVIWNSDQGSHFTSSHYIERLTKRGVQISMDRRGRALDNIFTERLWRTITYEEMDLNEYANPHEARIQLTAYWHWYNQQRLHQSLAYQTPAEVYFATKKEGSSPLANPFLLS